MNYPKVALSLLCLSLAASSAFAQTTKPVPQQPPAPVQPSGQQVLPDARLTVTVVDPRGDILPNSVVTLVPQDDAAKSQGPKSVNASDKGTAIFEGLVPGVYTIQATFAGLQPGSVKDVRIKSGDNKHVVALALNGVTETVTVGVDKLTAANDRSASFGTALTRDQIDALSDDPTEMAQQLQNMVGPDAVIRVDSFEGQQLPPKAQIKAIHITRDQFAAENHSAGGLFIDIITQPGIGPLRTNTGFNFYDSSLDGRNPLVAQKGPQRNETIRGGIGGTLIKNKADFSINFNGINNYATPILNAFTTAGKQVGLLDVRQPITGGGLSGLLNYSITKDQTIRLGFNASKTDNGNQGIGAYDLAERAFSTENQNFGIRFQEAGPLGRRFFINTRFQLNASDSSASSLTNAPTIRVLDAFTSGGAQQTGGTHNKNFTLASDLDYVRGINSWRAGIQLDGIHYSTDSNSNYLGTYTFASLDAFNAGTPENYTRRLGDPDIAYWQIQAGIYLQDDLRVSKRLTLSPGVRYEAQAHLKDYNNVAPRMGLTWSPSKSGKTTVRGSYGIFYDWLSANTYRQTVLFDGQHQEEINIINPSYPDPGIVGSFTPSNTYLLGPNLQMVRSLRASAGISQSVNSHFSIGASFADTHSNGVLVGQNLNAPIDGVRPNLADANVIETVSNGRSQSTSLNIFSSVNLSRSNSAPSGPVMVMNGMMMGMPGGAAAPKKAKFFDWRRNLNMFVNYTIANSQNNTDGAFAVPASGNLATEWGPSSFDIRHRASVSMSSGAIRNLNMSLSVFANSAQPLNITTGFDNNGDGILNDRPDGVGRNSARVPGYWNASMYLSYSFGFGKASTAMPGGIAITSGAGGLSATTMAAQSAPKYRLSLNLSINNLTNHATLTGYSGVITSPFFMQGTNASGVRTLNFSMNLSF